jgi:hypothetical protein
VTELVVMEEEAYGFGAGGYEVRQGLLVMRELNVVM